MKLNSLKFNVKKGNSSIRSQEECADGKFIEFTFFGDIYQGRYIKIIGIFRGGLKLVWRKNQEL